MLNNKANFKTEEQWLTEWEIFFEMVQSNGFKTFPTKKNFARNGGYSYSSVLDTFKRFPDSKEVIKGQLADVLAEGMANKAWNATGVIFCLKNWCGWADKNETALTKNTLSEIASLEQADKLVKAYMEKRGLLTIKN